MNAPYGIADLVVERFGAGEIVTVTLDGLRSVFAIVDDEYREEVVQAVAALLDPLSFNVRIGTWKLDVRRAALQSLVTVAIVSISTRFVGIDSVPFAVLVATIPFIVDVDRVTIRASDRVVLASLLTANVGRGLSDTLYDSLPTEIQRQLTRLEFADVVERIVESGKATRDALGVVELADDTYGTLALPLSRGPNEPDR
jgi:hypothetical protein